MLFACREVGMSFGSRPVLENVSLNAHAGEVLGVVGPNGAGKTTLFEILSGRLRPTRGQVFLEGRDITALPLHQRARAGPEYLGLAGAAAEGFIWGTVYGAYADKQGQAFRNAYQAEYVKPGQTMGMVYSGGGYDTIQLLAKAWASAEPEKFDAVNDTLRKLQYRGRVVVLNAGLLIAEGSPHTVFDEPRVRAAYFASDDVAAH
ncbi:hypothetical protein B566_EDAN018592 [Ephemera danica]|nr:hypothetical protein B566_EDAN018592 [Ephemera danica]